MKLNGIVKKTLLVGALSYGVVPCANVFAFDINDKVSIGGVVEVDFTSASDYDDVSSSDITLSTMELDIAAQVNEWVSGEAVLLWEEDDTEPVDLDSATITVGNTEKAPVYLTAGLMTVPFGVYESNMLSDPLTLSLGETSGSAALIGLEASGFYAKAYGFNGMDLVDEDDTVNVFGGSLGFAMENDSISLDVGADYINNLANSDGMSDSIADNELAEEIGGMAAHLILGLGNFTCIAEYVAATDAYMDAEPNATHLEAAFTSEMIGKETTLAATYQISSEAAGLLPETRYGATVSMGILENTSVSVEYIHDEDYSKEDGGTDGNADAVDVQLAIEF